MQMNYQRITNTVRALAIITFIALNSARRAIPLTRSILRRSHIARPPNSMLQISAQLADAEHKVNLAMPIKRAGHTVADSVNINQLTINRSRINRGQKNLSLRSQRQNLKKILSRLRVHWVNHLIMLGQQIINTHIVQCTGIAKRHRAAVNLLVQIGRRSRTISKMRRFIAFFGKSRQNLLNIKILHNIIILFIIQHMYHPNYEQL